MYFITVEEHNVDVRFTMKAPIYSQQAFTMFQACSVLDSTCYVFRTPALLSFSVSFFYSAIEIDLCSLYRRKVTAAFELKK